MDLDIQTLFFVSVFSAFVVSIVMLTIWRTRKSSSSLGWLAWGSFSLMVGSLLLPTRGYLPDFVVIVIGDSVYLLWAISLWQAIRVFQGRGDVLKNTLLPFSLFVCLLIYYTSFDFNAGMRVILLLLFIVGYSILALFDLIKPVHTPSPAVEHKFLAAIISVFIIFILFAIVMGSVADIEYNSSYLQGYKISILLSTLYNIAFALGFLWVLQRDFESRSEEHEHALQVANALAEKLRLQAENAALHDPLTSAGNRRKFENNANLERQRHLRHNHALCLAFIDIDHFKAVNDKFGHDIGDQVLKLLVTSFTDIIRNIDMVYRWGGEEFIILLPETDLNKAILVCERIREHIQFTLSVDKEQITVSIGVTQLDAQESINNLVKRADKLLYEAKQSGRNCVVGR
jgi:diguanylate cyclase (GGDEF)-like protein